jgi:hypothetical protein
MLEHLIESDIAGITHLGATFRENAARVYAGCDQASRSRRPPAPRRRDYRDKVLAAGGARLAAQSVEDFLGCPYNFEAFAESLAVDGESGPGAMR